MEEEKKGRKDIHFKRISKKEMEELMTKIDMELQRFIREGKYKDVLTMMGNLARYSLNNQIYIIMQKPDARTVHGMKHWNRLGRHVIPGEKSIKIFSPILAKKEKDETSVEEKEKGHVCRGFKLGYVFDVSQTEGKKIDAFRFDEKKLVDEKDNILEGLRKTASEQGYSIQYATKEELGNGCYGLCNHMTKKIKILQGMGDLQEISTTVHECGHALAHSNYREDFEGLTPHEKREIKEVEAESIACAVCTHLGLDTQNFNFSYITGWADGDIAKFRKNLDVISKHAKTLIDVIEKELSPEKKETNLKEETPLTNWIPKKEKAGATTME